MKYVLNGSAQIEDARNRLRIQLITILGGRASSIKNWLADYYKIDPDFMDRPGKPTLLSRLTFAGLRYSRRRMQFSDTWISYLEAVKDKHDNCENLYTAAVKWLDEFQDDMVLCNAFNLHMFIVFKIRARWELIQKLNRALEIPHTELILNDDESRLLGADV